MTPCCPLCGQPPVMVFGGGTQAFCGTDDCKALIWNPEKTVDENLLDTRFVDLTFREDGCPDA